MPQPRKAKASEDPSCSFCGQHKDAVPLMIASNTTSAKCCSWCALGIIEQTFKHGLMMEQQVRQHLVAQKEATTPQIQIANKVDKVDVAVQKALKRGLT